MASGLQRGIGGEGGLKLSNNENKKQEECRRVQKSKLPEIWLNQNHFNVLEKICTATDQPVEDYVREALLSIMFSDLDTHDEVGLKYLENLKKEFGDR
jgi:hypothetical protein